MIDETQVKVYAWYDNEWGYVNRMMDIARQVVGAGACCRVSGRWTARDLDTNTRNYLTVTGGYWAFTVTDGAIRMLVVLYFHLSGIRPSRWPCCSSSTRSSASSPIWSAAGWVARIGLNLTMHIGMGLQVVALGMLTVPDAWLTVRLCDGRAGAVRHRQGPEQDVAPRRRVKTLVPGADGESRLFKYVAILTGSKNALKGVGFFVGGGAPGPIGLPGGPGGAGGDASLSF